MNEANALPISSRTLADIECRLGRPPRGLEAVALYGVGGDPWVIRVASLVDDKPFPNLFWLIEPKLVYRIDCDEAGGLIRRLQQRVDQSPNLRESMADDHRAFIELRNQHMTPTIKQRAHQLNYFEVLQRRGIGGIEDFSRIRCLHTWYAAHLVVPNTIGHMLDKYWTEIDSVNTLT